MADSEDMDTGKKKLPQTLPELVWEYKEAMDFATEDHFENLSVWESKGQLDLCGDSSHRGDLNQLYPISQVSTTGIEDGDTIAAGIEHDDTIANSVEMQIPSDDDRSADGIEDDDTNADGIEDDDTNADGIEDDDTYSDSVAMQMLGLDDRNADIMRPDLTWEQMVVKVLHMIRCRELTEYNHKLQIPVTTRFCLFNIALFDLDEESKIKPRPLFRDIPTSDYWMLENSVNVISIKVEVSDVGYPINIFGTVVARDEVDYRCVYLFNRGRDNPQLITSPVDTLTLTGPNRSLAVTDTMYFEFHLKIKDDGAVDKDFCKGLLEHNTVRHTLPTMRLSLESWLSTVKLEFTVVPFAVEASVAVSILKGPSTLNGKIVAWTTGNNEKIVLYDSGVEGTKTEIGTDGFVALTRCIMAVPLDEDLVINVSLGGNDREAECLKFFTGNDVEKCTKMLSPYELQVKIVWRGVIKQRPPSCGSILETLEFFGDKVVCI